MKRLKLGNYRHGQDIQFQHRSWGAIASAAISVVGGMVAKNNGPKAAGAVPYDPVNPQASARAAILGNMNNEGDIEQLLARANNFQQGQANDLMEKAVPGYGRLSQTLMARAQSQADNPYAVPKDVQDNLTRLAAEKGISRGTRGQTNQYSLLRDLGVNELQFGQDNLKNSLGALTTLTGMAPRVSPASPASLWLTPAQELAATTDNNTKAQVIGQGAANAGAAASNASNQAMWDAIMKGAGTAVSGINWTGSADPGTGGHSLGDH